MCRPKSLSRVTFQNSRCHAWHSGKQQFWSSRFLVKSSPAQPDFHNVTKFSCSFCLGACPLWNSVEFVTDQKVHAKQTNRASAILHLLRQLCVFLCRCLHSGNPQAHPVLCHSLHPGNPHTHSVFVSRKDQHCCPHFCKFVPFFSVLHRFTALS